MRSDMAEEKIPVTEAIAEEENTQELPCEKESKEDKDKDKEKKDSKKTKELKAKLADAEKEAEALGAKLAEANDKYLRLAAEYENFRKRSQREREGIYGDAYLDAIGKLLPTVDNLERASQYSDPEKLAEGVKMILGTLPETLKSLGIEVFGDAGEEFDPNIHNAVMMVADENTESGKIAAVLQKGYRRGDKVLRYAMVTVAE